MAFIDGSVSEQLFTSLCSFRFPLSVNYAYHNRAYFSNRFDPMHLLKHMTPFKYGFNGSIRGRHSVEKQNRAVFNLIPE